MMMIKEAKSWQKAVLIGLPGLTCWQSLQLSSQPFPPPPPSAKSEGQMSTVCLASAAAVAVNFAVSALSAR